MVVTVPVMVIVSPAAAIDETVSSPPLVIDASLVDDVPVKIDDETLTLQVT